MPFPRADLLQVSRRRGRQVPNFGHMLRERKRERGRGGGGLEAR